MKKRTSKNITVVALMLIITIILSTTQSCHKYIINSLPPISRGSCLIQQVWGLTSASSIDSLSSGSKFVVRGNLSDSLLFEWALGLSVTIYGVKSFNNGDSTVYAISRIGKCGNANGTDTSTIAFDTIMLGAPWKQGYSDTLFITKTSPTRLVFQVKYSLPTGSGVEIDTFHTVRYF